jgi:hypothetical protein
MAFDVEAARAEGYSDEDIQKYLASQGQTMTGQPMPATPAVATQVPMDRSNEYITAAQAAALGGGAALAGKALVLDPIRQGIGNLIKGAVAPQGVPAAPTQSPQPNIMQRGMDYASKMRQMAAQRVMPMAASGAAVPAGVAAGGAAATGIAGGQMAAMTPEQRKAYYDSMMLGAMSGDAGLAAAIMNRGQ